MKFLVLLKIENLDTVQTGFMFWLRPEAVS